MISGIATVEPRNGARGGESIFWEANPGQSKLGSQRLVGWKAVGLPGAAGGQGSTVSSGRLGAIAAGWCDMLLCVFCTREGLHQLKLSCLAKERNSSVLRQHFVCLYNRG